MRVLCALALVWLAGGLAAASDKGARQLYDQARKAERKGQIIEAYLLYSQAAARDPKTMEYWLRAQGLRVKATLMAKEKVPQSGIPTPAGPAAVAEATEAREPAIEEPPGAHRTSARGTEAVAGAQRSGFSRGCANLVHPGSQAVRARSRFRHRLPAQRHGLPLPAERCRLAGCDPGAGGCHFLLRGAYERAAVPGGQGHAAEAAGTRTLHLRDDSHPGYDQRPGNAGIDERRADSGSAHPVGVRHDAANHRGAGPGIGGAAGTGADRATSAAEDRGIDRG